jgi:UDP-2-acetamido-3-amino-2,3-dideoxy-glucuronate N-acetyltransferase
MRTQSGGQQVKYQNIYKSEIGKNTKIASFVEIGGSKVGDNCSIQAFVYIPPGVTIGNNVFIGPRVTFTNDLYPPSGGKHWKNTVVKDGASIGAGSVILAGVEIGENSLIGAGSVVTKSIPPNSVAYGNPCKVRRKK